jgi:hypothetical protein
MRGIGRGASNSVEHVWVTPKFGTCLHLLYGSHQITDWVEDSASSVTRREQLLHWVALLTRHLLGTPKRPERSWIRGFLPVRRHSIEVS